MNLRQKLKEDHDILKEEIVAALAASPLLQKYTVMLGEHLDYLFYQQIVAHNEIKQFTGIPEGIDKAKTSLGRMLKEALKPADKTKEKQ